MKNDSDRTLRTRFPDLKRLMMDVFNICSIYNLMDFLCYSFFILTLQGETSLGVQKRLRPWIASAWSGENCTKWLGDITNTLKRESNRAALDLTCLAV
jgi:hypothetical protein